MEFNFVDEGLAGLLRNVSDFEKTLEEILMSDDRICRADVMVLGGPSRQIRKR